MGHVCVDTEYNAFEFLLFEVDEQSSHEWKCWRRDASDLKIWKGVTEHLFVC